MEVALVLIVGKAGSIITVMVKDSWRMPFIGTLDFNSKCSFGVLVAYWLMSGVNKMSVSFFITAEEPKGSFWNMERKGG